MRRPSVMISFSSASDFVCTYSELSFGTGVWKNLSAASLPLPFGPWHFAQVRSKTAFPDSPAASPDCRITFSWLWPCGVAWTSNPPSPGIHTSESTRRPSKESKTRVASYARRRREAEAAALPFAQRASWWLWARRSDLNEVKTAAVHGNGFDIDMLAAAAQELHRLETLAPGGVVRAYLQFEAEYPAECARLVSIGSAWEETCRAVVGNIIRQIGWEQRKAAMHAA